MTTFVGGADFDMATAFIRQRFLELNQTPKVIYTHFTCAVNKENVEVVFKCVKDTILKKVITETTLH